MDLGEMMLEAQYGRDPDYLEAKRVYEEAYLESEKLAGLREVNLSLMAAAERRAYAAAESYVATLEDEISVAPAKQCDCQNDANA
jgi:hypothetical protein